MPKKIQTIIKQESLPIEEQLRSSNKIALPQDTLDAQTDILVQGTNPNTRKTYRAALKYWSAWHHARFNSPLPLLKGKPLSEAAALQFCTDHFPREKGTRWLTTMTKTVATQLNANGMAIRFDRDGAPLPPKLSTTDLRIAVIREAHRLKRVVSPFDDPNIEKTVENGRRLATRAGLGFQSKEPITREGWHEILECFGDDLESIRDKALFLLSLARRARSELSAATWENLKAYHATKGKGSKSILEPQFVLTLTEHKTGGAGKDLRIPIKGEAAKALLRWQSVCASAGFVGGPIFRRLRKTRAKSEAKIGEPIAPDGIYHVLMKCYEMAGFDVKSKHGRKDYGAHSLRNGFITQALDDGVHLVAAMEMTGHKSVNTVRQRYYNPKEVLSNPAADLISPK